MSEKLPDNTENQEVDLGQLFIAIGKMFEKFFNFIGKIFKAFFFDNYLFFKTVSK